MIMITIIIMIIMIITMLTLTQVHGAGPPRAADAAAEAQERVATKKGALTLATTP